MPDVNGAEPPGLQPLPHQPAYVALPSVAIDVVWAPAPRSCWIFQSHSRVPQVVDQPRPWLSQTYWPPATQCRAFDGSASNGAMNRGFGSHGDGVNSTLAHAGEMVRYDRVVPSLRPPLVVTAMLRSTYSFTALSPFAGSTS